MQEARLQQLVGNDDIGTLADVRLLVDTFYGRARQDELIGPVFNNTIQDRWPEHLEKLYRFWQTILLGERTYQGAPFIPHFPLGIDERHFNRWLMVFQATIDELFAGPKAEEAKQRAGMMAQMFQYKMATHARMGTTPLR
ncbi:MAG: group III truncated hemoglobin [Flavobacteriales bacterium]|nr:group III truncated hemoglobin [Flavobacteriales bacterium]MBP9078917.1 group III truncated hemoglobin [Flavobacteriales bacterium]